MAKKKKKDWFDEHVIVDCGGDKKMAKAIKERLRSEIHRETVVVEGFGDRTKEVADILRSSLKTLKRQFKKAQKGGK